MTKSKFDLYGLGSFLQGGICPPYTLYTSLLLYTGPAQSPTSTDIGRFGVETGTFCCGRHHPTTTTTQSNPTRRRWCLQAAVCRYPLSVSRVATSNLQRTSSVSKHAVSMLSTGHANPYLYIYAPPFTLVASACLKV